MLNFRLTRPNPRILGRVLTVFLRCPELSLGPTRVVAVCISTGKQRMPARPKAMAKVTCDSGIQPLAPPDSLQKQIQGATPPRGRHAPPLGGIRIFRYSGSQKKSWNVVSGGTPNSFSNPLINGTNLTFPILFGNGVFAFPHKPGGTGSFGSRNSPSPPEPSQKCFDQQTRLRKSLPPTVKSTAHTIRI